MKVVIAGAGGQARVVLGILSHYPDIEVVGVADRTSSTIGQSVGKASIVACWDELPDWRIRGIDAIVLALGDNAERELMYNQVLQMGYEVLGIRHPTSIIEHGASVGPACILCAGSIICSDAEIRENVLINTGSIVEHECKIASHAHIGPGVRIAGRVSVGERSFLGIGSCVIENTRIGRDVILGAGSVVLCNLPDGAVAYGVPACIREQQ